MKCQCCDIEDDVKKHLIVGPTAKSVEMNLCGKHRHQVDGVVALNTLEGNTSEEQRKLYNRSFGSLLDVIAEI